jgi:hypothetical protein
MWQGKPWRGATEQERQVWAASVVADSHGFATALLMKMGCEKAQDRQVFDTRAMFALRWSIAHLYYLCKQGMIDAAMSRFRAVMANDQEPATVEAALLRSISEAWLRGQPPEEGIDEVLVLELAVRLECEESIINWLMGL